MMITVFLVSGCVEEPQALTDPTPTPTQTPNITVTANANTTYNITITRTHSVTTLPTPKAKPTPKEITIAQSGDELPWCDIKYECDNGIRKYNSEICISVHEMPQLTMDYYCGLIIQTSSETKPPRDTYANGTVVNVTNTITNTNI